MKALSLLQPWATLVAIGAKQIETRSWGTSYRGPLAIAASKGLPCSASRYRLLCANAPFGAALTMAGYPLLSFDYHTEYWPPLGAILCVCDLVDVVRITADNAPPEPEWSFGDYTPGRFAWHLTNVRALPTPIPAKGSLGLWTPDLGVWVKLERFYREGAA